MATLPPLNESRRSLVYKRACEILRTSPRLAAVRTWILGLGEPADSMKLVASMMPWIRCWPYTRRVDRIAEGRNFIEFGVYLEIATSGTSWLPFLDLWEAIEDAMANDEPTHETTVRLYLSGQVNGWCDGAKFTGVEQDPAFGLRGEDNQIIGRVGRGLIILPFTKRA